MLTAHTIIYFSTLLVSYLLVYLGWWIFYLSLSWGLFGLVSVGHELYHLPVRTQSQELLAFCCLDLWVAPKAVWIRKHNKEHHLHVWEAYEEEHLVEGGLITNLIHTFTTLVSLYEVLTLRWESMILMLFRLLIFSPLGWYAIIIVYSLVTIFVTGLTFIAHTAPILREETAILKQVHRALDIFPYSSVMILLWGGFNLHATHHLAPTVTRDQLQLLHEKHRVKYGYDLRVITSWRELYRLYQLQGQTFPDLESWYVAMEI